MDNDLVISQPIRDPAQRIHLKANLKKPSSFAIKIADCIVPEYVFL